jgi:hypothetical protein
MCRSASELLGSFSFFHFFFSFFFHATSEPTKHPHVDSRTLPWDLNFVVENQNFGDEKKMPKNWKTAKDTSVSTHTNAALIILLSVATTIYQRKWNILNQNLKQKYFHFAFKILDFEKNSNEMDTQLSQTLFAIVHGTV